MKIQIKCLGKVVYESKPMHKDSCSILYNLMCKHKKLLPKLYNRHKQNRKYCYNIDKKISALLKEDLFFSSYSGRRYTIEMCV